VIDRHQDRLELVVFDLPFCFLPGYERFLAGDASRLGHHVITTHAESVDLPAYLSRHRVRRPVCEPCPHAVHCGGFVETDAVDDPPWLVPREALVRRPRAASS
jgi:hypothetical protein